MLEGDLVILVQFRNRVIYGEWAEEHLGLDLHGLGFQVLMDEPESEAESD